MSELSSEYLIINVCKEPKLVNIDMYHIALKKYPDLCIDEINEHGQHFLISKVPDMKSTLIFPFIFGSGATII